MTFDSHYRRDSLPPSCLGDLSLIAEAERGASGITSFLSTHAGASYEEGLYRIHPVSEIRRWTSLVAEAFPDFGPRILCFAYDWLGRHFALDYYRTSDDQFLILMLEPGTGQALEVPTTFIQFHEQELIQYRNEALAGEFYQQWLALGGQRPSLTECVGYKKPLFLGGVDDVANLELIDMEVYWAITGQLTSKLRGSDEGSHIKSIRIE
jgi:hypothetical protein